MKARAKFVSNSSTSSWVINGEGKRVIEQIAQELDNMSWASLLPEEKEKHMKKWAEWIQNVDTEGEYDG